MSATERRQQIGDQVLMLKYQFDLEMARNERMSHADRLQSWDALLERLNKPLALYARLEHAGRPAAPQNTPAANVVRYAAYLEEP